MERLRSFTARVMNAMCIAMQPIVPVRRQRCLQVHGMRTVQSTAERSPSLVEGAALEMRYTGQLVSRVRIPLAPPRLHPLKLAAMRSLRLSKGDRGRRRQLVFAGCSLCCFMRGLQSLQCNCMTPAYQWGHEPGATDVAIFRGDHSRMTSQLVWQATPA